jgi:predicted metalloprotease with PDZ domain
MLQCRKLLLVLLVSTLVSLPGIARDPIAYTLRFPDAAAHYMDVEMVVPTEGANELNLFLPTWTPGSYLVREYSRNIISMDAAASGSALEVTKTSKNRWIVESEGVASVTINYRLFCREINVRNNWVETDFAVVNGAPTFITIVDDYKRPYLVTVELPSGWETTASPLPSADTANSYSAPDFGTLVDSPLIAGSPQVDRFEVDGILHSLVTIGGGGVWDNARAARNVQHLVEAQRTFWGGLPYDEPYVFFNLLTGSRGGLEHKQSMLMTGDRWYTKNRGGIRSWLSLVSHEFFHAWNGKRLRPVELGPFEYEHENYSPSLWVVEGLTSYYQHILLARAGYHTHEKYLGALSGSIAGTEKTPGRFVQSLSESSFDAWIKAYRKDENSINALFSYYSGGAVAGFLMDAKIQQETDGARRRPPCRVRTLQRQVRLHRIRVHRARKRDCRKGSNRLVRSPRTPAQPVRLPTRSRLVRPRIRKAQAARIQLPTGSGRSGRPDQRLARRRHEQQRRKPKSHFHTKRHPSCRRWAIRR